MNGKRIIAVLVLIIAVAITVWFVARWFGREAQLLRRFPALDDERTAPIHLVANPLLPVQVEDRTIVVMFRETAPLDDIQRILTEQRLEVVSRIAELSFFVVRLRDAAAPPTPEGTSTLLETRIRKLKSERRFVLAAAPNVAIGGTIVPQPNAPPRGWFSGADDPLIHSRFPEAWNFNKAIEKKKTVEVGILDEGFLDTQNDLAVEQPSECARIPFRPHGTEVAGIIGASWGNGFGVDGAAPFAKLIGCACPVPVFDGMATNLNTLIKRKTLRVINVSLGYRWTTSPMNDPGAKRVVREHGIMIRRVLRAHPEVIVVSAAGNGCRVADCAEDARWSSPFNWATLDREDNAEEPPVDNVIVVEALDRTNSGRLTISNVGGTFRAIGDEVFTTVGTDAYQRRTGTSAAAPLVSATIAMMLAVHPDITVDEIKRNLGVGSADPKLNAFEAVRLSNPKASMHLADLSGDGHVNGEDFERFKRALQQVRAGRATEDLNGDSPIHPNEDLQFCRMDLNGKDGVTAADLDVMIEAWDGPAAERDTLRDRLNR